MNRILLSISILLYFSTGKINAQGNCVVPPSLAIAYQDDIGALAVNYVLTTADSDFIAVPASYYNEVAEGMAAIFNSSFPERDSVFDLYCVHWPWGISIGKNWMISFDTSYSWTAAWQNAQTVTGNPAIDNLFSTHQLTVTNYYDWSGTHVVTVSGTHVINHDALSDSLGLIQGILWSEPDQLIGTAGTITYSKSGNTRHYEFTVEWNDCFDGCDNSHTWKFDVDTNCNVTFAGTADFWVFSNDPLPAPLNCNIASVPEPAANSLSIFPNPFLSHLNIRTNERSEIILYDLTWRKLLHQTFINSVTLDTEELAAGIYICKIRNNSGAVQIKKIVKD